MSIQYPHPYNLSDDDDLYDENFAVASTMECTGLIPAAPASVQDVDSYNEIYDIPLSKNAEAANNHLQKIKKDGKNSYT